MKAVSDERRWEFAMENQRWFDLLRFSTTMPSVNAESSYEKITFVMAPYYSQFDTPSQLLNYKPK
jgi:hypothetical protein